MLETIWDPASQQPTINLHPGTYTGLVTGDWCCRGGGSHATSGQSSVTATGGSGGRPRCDLAGAGTLDHHWWPRPRICMELRAALGQAASWTHLAPVRGVMASTDRVTIGKNIHRQELVTRYVNEWCLPN